MNDDSDKKLLEECVRSGQVDASQVEAHIRHGEISLGLDPLPNLKRIPKVFLSRRNLQALLSKLDRKAAGEVTHCSIIKKDNTHKRFPQTMSQIQVTAVEDEDYYDDRSPGAIHPADEGPGTPSARLNHLLSELKKRFPDAHCQFMSDPPEPKLLAEIDKLLKR